MALGIASIYYIRVFDEPSNHIRLHSIAATNKL